MVLSHGMAPVPSPKLERPRAHNPSWLRDGVSGDKVMMGDVCAQSSQWEEEKEDYPSQHPDQVCHEK